MALLGQAALAMWWDMAPEVNAEFQDWHSHEHFRERLAIPGFARATRWSSADGGEGVFQMYELDAHATLSSPRYLAHLNAPSPWSTKMMPHHRNMVRSQCHVLASFGGNVARHALVIRLSPAPGADAALLAALQTTLAPLVDQPGCVGAHLLRHEAPVIAQTTEQKIRGSDRFADWVLVVVGYDLGALQVLAAASLSPESLARLGAQPGASSGTYTLSFSATALEMAK
ncbi:MAG: antibiotic biosynthesis monooxygenase [Pseudomonadota bacterium]